MSKVKPAVMAAVLRILDETWAQDVPSAEIIARIRSEVPDAPKRCFTAKGLGTVASQKGYHRTNPTALKTLNLRDGNGRTTGNFVTRTPMPSTLAVGAILKADWPADVPVHKIVARVVLEVPDASQNLRTADGLRKLAGKLGLTRTDTNRMRGTNQKRKPRVFSESPSAADRAAARTPEWAVRVRAIVAEEWQKGTAPGDILARCLAEVADISPKFSHAGRVVDLASKMGLPKRERVVERVAQPTDWSPQAKAAIRDLYLAGVSITQVARRLSGRLDGGRVLTRNAVCTLADRNNWRRVAASGVGGLPASPVKIVERSGAIAPLKPVGEGIRHRPVVFEGARNVTLFERTAGCCYITGEGDGGALYCGMATTGSARKPYCAEHYRLMYEPGSGMKRVAGQGLATLGPGFAVLKRVRHG